MPQRVSFHIAVSAGWAPVSAARIELSRDRWKSVEKSWDTAESRRGWTFGSPKHPTHIVFCCARSLAEGTWEWRARAVGRAGESQPSRPVSFRVDGTPPAEIEDLRVLRRPDGGVSLSWDPVIVDVDGKPETVDHYVVYRYEARGIFPQSSPTRLGQTRAITYDDRSLRRAGAPPSRSAAGKAFDETRTVYYKVVAVDLAGNEIGLREAHPSPLADGGL